MGRNVELAIGALNGLVGDYLARAGNGLATTMQVMRRARPSPSDGGESPAPASEPAAVEVTRDGLEAAFAGAGAGEAPRKLVVLVHGLMSTEDVWRMEDGHTYGTLLARDLGYGDLELRFNSGLRISENGEMLDAILGALASSYPGAIDEIALVGHSMGGLVIRSASHAAAQRDSAWLPLARRAFYLGSPHLGSPLERAGNAVSWALRKVNLPVTALVAEIANLRSQGLKDLRYGNLRREDWDGADADELLRNRRHPVPLLEHIRHHLVAGSISVDPVWTALFGDVLVPVRSATGRAREVDRCAPFPQEHVALLPGFNHLRLAHDGEVYARIRAWCEEPVT